MPAISSFSGAGAAEVVTPEQSAEKDIEVGMDMFLGDRVRTFADSRLQVLLLDETTLTLRPEGSILIDEMVYEPDSGGPEFDSCRGKLRDLAMSRILRIVAVQGVGESVDATPPKKA